MEGKPDSRATKNSAMPLHYNDVIMGTIASQVTSLTVVYSTVYSDADQRKHQSSASLAFVRWIRRGPVNSPHKWPVTRKMFQFDDVIMMSCQCYVGCWGTVSVVQSPCWEWAPCFVIQIKYGLPYCVTCPSMSTDPGSLNPGTRRSRVPGWWDPGIRRITGAGDTVLAKHT